MHCNYLKCAYYLHLSQTYVQVLFKARAFCLWRFVWVWPALAFTSVHFDRDQICAQVDVNFSPSGHPTQVNVSFVEVLTCSERKSVEVFLFFATSVNVRWSKIEREGRGIRGRKCARRFFLAPASDSRSMLLQRLLRRPRVNCRATLFGHPTQVCTQVHMSKLASPLGQSLMPSLVWTRPIRCTALVLEDNFDGFDNYHSNVKLS